MATIYLHPTVLHSEASMAAFQRLHGLLIAPPPSGSNYAIAAPLSAYPAATSARGAAA